MRRGSQVGEVEENEEKKERRCRGRWKEVEGGGQVERGGEVVEGGGEEGKGGGGTCEGRGSGRGVGPPPRGTTCSPPPNRIHFQEV